MAGFNLKDAGITPAAILADVQQRLTVQQSDNTAGFFRIRSANQCIAEAKTQPVPRNLYRQLLFENEITFLFADTGIGKSIFAVQIGNEISKTDKVLYFDLELSDKQFQKRYSDDDYQNEFVFNENFTRIDFIRPFEIPGGQTYEAYFIDSLKRSIEHAGAHIIIIDNMTKLISADTDNARTTKPLMDLLTELKFELNLTMLLLEHTRKTDNMRPISLNDLQGSKMKANFADAAFSIGRSAKDKNLRYIKQLKCRSSEMEYDTDNVPVYEVVKENSFLQFRFLQYDTEYNHLKHIDDTEKENRKQKAQELKAQNVSNREIARQIGVSEGAVRKWFK